MASQPRHVDGCAGAAVGVRRGAVEGGDVVACVNHQEVVTADTAETQIQLGISCVFMTVWQLKLKGNITIVWGGKTRPEEDKVSSLCSTQWQIGDV